jgi:hypothetical protein
VSEATGESAEAVKDAIAAVPEENARVDLTTVEMMSAFGDTWIWTDVTPDQAQEIYKWLGEPQVTRKMGETEAVGAGQVVEGTVVEHTGEVSTAVDDPVEK